MSQRDYYADLGLAQHATGPEIKQAFHALAKQHHPDKSGSDDTSAFLRAREAYEKLSDTTFRKQYDLGYQFSRMQFDTAEAFTRTRTAAFEAEEAEEAERKAREQRQNVQQRSWLPPPFRPARRANESSASYYLGKPYIAWQKREAAYAARHPEYEEAQQQAESLGASAHGLRVLMSSHPSTEQRCTQRTTHWNMQSAGSNVCVFCLRCGKGCCRCPGCEAIACATCLSEIIEKERTVPFAGFSPSRQYRPSGG